MKHFSHLNTAADILGRYKGSGPFHLFIKDFFRQNKKYGSKDRKQVTHLCYCYFRMGAALKEKPLQEAITIALFLCSRQHNELLAAVQPAWNDKANASLEEKCALLNIAPGTLQIFPFAAEPSNGIDTNEFNFSHLIQPEVFIRLRPGHADSVVSKLEKADIIFTRLQPDCLGMPVTTKIDALLEVNKEVVIQDYNSQRTGDMMRSLTPVSRNFTAWDCCAASGGKSIMAKDILGNIDLTVSDIRTAVLINLKKRFSEAGINHYKTMAADLSSNINPLQKERFDFIIADVPCTGSGTWGRTPERLSFFEEKEINNYNQLQKKIVSAAISCLKTGGHFLYITCSVFKKENEDVVEFIQTQLSAELVNMRLLKGYNMKADTMFAAMLVKR